MVDPHMMRPAKLAALFALCGVATAFGQPAPESVYAPPALPREDEGVNLGGVHFDFSVSYFTDYVYRGVEVFERPGLESTGSEDQLNLQFDTKVSFDLGKLPHPFFGLFVNVGEDDPVSDFQEVRPIVGFDWTIKPLVFTVGHISYLYPDRDAYETSEIFAKIELDDSILIRGATLPSPYVLAAYDYDLYTGIYVEAGIKYRIPFDDLGFQLTAIGSIAYVDGYNATVDNDGVELPGFFTSEQTADDDVHGFQHYQIGLIGEYSLNRLFNTSNRFGSWSLQGYLFYTEDLDDEVGATEQLWGGAGITFRY
jgi:hypothetical protein